MRFFWRRRHKVDDTASYSSVNVWYGADDAPGVIDVDISSPVNVLDYYSYNAFNSVAYTNRDGSGDDDGGKIEYVYVHGVDDTFEDLSSHYQLEEEQEEGGDDDIVAEEAFVDGDEILEREEEEEKREESVGVVVVVDAEVEEALPYVHRVPRVRNLYIRYKPRAPLRENDVPAQCQVEVTGTPRRGRRLARADVDFARKRWLAHFP